MNSEDDIRSRYPLHYLVWSDDKDGLKRYLKQDTKVGREVVTLALTPPQANLELKDPRGRTPLMLAVTLGFKKCARILLNHNACVNVTDATGFNGRTGQCSAMSHPYCLYCSSPRSRLPHGPRVHPRRLRAEGSTTILEGGEGYSQPPLEDM